MFLKQERPEIDDFEKGKNFGYTGNQKKKDVLAKIHKTFVHILLFQKFLKFASVPFY